MKKALLLTILALIFLPKTVQAQTLSLSIWPPLLQVTLKPGKSITQVYRIQNQGDDTVINAQIVPFEALDELGHIKILNEPLQALNYFSLLNADLESLGVGHLATFPLEAGATQELVLKVTVPEVALSEDHYMTLLLVPDNKHLLSGTGAKGQGLLGANILLAVDTNEPINQTGKIEEFSLPCRLKNFICLMDSFDDFAFKVRVKNTSNHFFKAIGQLNISNLFNQTTTLPFREDNILAQSVRQLQLNANWQPIFPLGRYSAEVEVTPENSVNSISQTISFWVLPYKAILGLGLVVLFYYLLKQKKLLS